MRENRQMVPFRIKRRDGTYLNEAEMFAVLEELRWRARPSFHEKTFGLKGAVNNRRFLEALHEND